MWSGASATRTPERPRDRHRVHRGREGLARRAGVRRRLRRAAAAQDHRAPRGERGRETAPRRRVQRRRHGACRRVRGTADTRAPRGARHGARRRKLGIGPARRRRPSPEPDEGRAGRAPSSVILVRRHAPPRTTAHDAVPPSVILVRRHGNPRPRPGRPATTPSPLPSFSCADTPPPRGRPPTTPSPLPSFSCVDTGIHAPAADDRTRRCPPFRHSRTQTRESTPPPRTTALDAPLPSSSCADTGIHAPAADDRTRRRPPFRHSRT